MPDKTPMVFSAHALVGHKNVLFRIALEENGSIMAPGCAGGRQRLTVISGMSIARNAPECRCWCKCTGDARQLQDRREPWLSRRIVTPLQPAAQVQVQPLAQTTNPAQVDVVLMSPPWGGVDYYKKQQPFDVESPDCFGLGTNLAGLFSVAQQALRGGSGCIVVFLPRNAHLQQVS